MMLCALSCSAYLVGALKAAGTQCLSPPGNGELRNYYLRFDHDWTLSACGAQYGVFLCTAQADDAKGRAVQQSYTLVYLGGKP